MKRKYPSRLLPLLLEIKMLRTQLNLFLNISMERAATEARKLNVLFHIEIIKPISIMLKQNYVLFRKSNNRINYNLVYCDWDYTHNAKTKRQMGPNDI